MLGLALIFLGVTLNGRLVDSPRDDETAARVSASDTTGLQRREADGADTTEISEETLDGHWSGTWGDMYFRLVDGQVRAVYAYRDGRVIGSVDGLTIYGWWSEAPRRRPPAAGRVEFELVRHNGQLRLYGKWWSGNRGVAKVWNARKVDAGVPLAIQSKFAELETFVGPS